MQALEGGCSERVVCVGIGVVVVVVGVVGIGVADHFG